MGCCIAIATVIAVVRTLYFRLFPHRRPPESGFAPPAYRPAPGAPETAHRPHPTTSSEAPVVAVAWTSLVLGSVAITLAGYAAILELSALAGLGNGGAPMSRHLLLVGVGLASLIAAATWSGRTVPPTRGRGVVLAAAGATWTVASLIDMHVFGVLRHSANSWFDRALLVHAIGLAALAVGLGLLLRPSRDPRPSGLPLRTATTARTP